MKIVLSVFLCLLLISWWSSQPVAAHEFDFHLNYVDDNIGCDGTRASNPECNTTKPGWVRDGDIDLDGDLDLVVGGGRKLFVYENDGTPNKSHWNWFGSLDGTNEIGANGGELMDVDGDGDLDVVSAKYYKELGWWENPGGSLSNNLWSFHPFYNTNWYMHDGKFFDMDGDGIAQEFVANLNNGYWGSDIKLIWFEVNQSNPKGSWQPHTIENGRNEGGIHGHAGIDIKDIDGDGDRDLAYSNGWYERNSADSWTWHEVTNIYGISNALIHDLNQDGDMDLVVSAGHHGQGAYWFKNDGNENFGQPKNISPIDTSNTSSRYIYNTNHEYLHHPECLQIEDLDLDGDPDVVTCELFFGEDSGEPGWDEQKSNVFIYQNLGGGNSWQEINIAPNTYPNHLLQLVDINKDGLKDIIGDAAGYGAVSYFENHSGYSPSIRLMDGSDWELVVVDGNYAGNGKPGWSASGDFNKDGLVDVLSGGGQAVQWYQGSNWTKQSIENPTNVGGNGVIVADINSDGHMDFVTADYNASLNWFENDGSANFTSHTIQSGGQASNFNHDLAYADMDNDGVKDVIALYVGNSGGIHWYNPTNNWARTEIKSGTVDPYVGLATADLDEDGDNDVVISNTMYKNPLIGGGDWTGVQLFPEAVQNLYVYDVNGDSKQDIVGAQGFEASGKIWWSQAPNWVVHTVATGLNGPENLWVGDVNGDSFVDILTGEMYYSNGANDSDSNFIAFSSEDEGANWQRQSLHENVGISARLTPVDIDKDGDIDFTADGNAENHIYLWKNLINNSSLPPPPPTPTNPPTPTVNPQQGDADGDMDVDIFDYNILLDQFGSNGSSLSADFDNDEDVDIFDYNILLTNFGVVGPPSSMLVTAINAGGAEYTSTDDINYTADNQCGANGGTASLSNVDLPNTNDDSLYQSECWGNFTYQIPVTNGTYDVTMKFAEVWSGGQNAGERIFDILLEEQIVIDELDLSATVGYLEPYEETHRTVVSDGTITIVGSATVNNAKISAIIVKTQGTDEELTPTPGSTPTSTPIPGGSSGWGSISVANATDGLGKMVTLENNKLLVVYQPSSSSWAVSANGRPSSIDKFIVKGVDLDNNGQDDDFTKGSEPGRFDNHLHQREMTNAVVTYDGNDKKTVQMTFNSGAKQDVTIYPDSDMLEIYYYSTDFLITDWAGWPKGDNVDDQQYFAVYGADRWHRTFDSDWPYGLHPKGWSWDPNNPDHYPNNLTSAREFGLGYDEMYYNRIGGDADKQGEMDPADGGSLSYNNHFILGAYKKADNHGFGRVLPVDKTKALIIWSYRGWEFVPQGTDFTTYFFPVTSGAGEIISKGQQLIDNGI